MPVLANATQQAAIVFDIARSCSLIIFASGVRDQVLKTYGISLPWLAPGTALRRAVATYEK